jgi:16S rRNA (cytosine967-C5)-methyltransferase
MSRPSTREIALRTLRRIEREGAFSNRALHEELEKHPELDIRDRGFCTTLVYGVLRHHTRLDQQIDAFAHNPRKLKGELRTILRIAALELRELERPLRVASSEAIKLSGKLDPRGRLKGLLTAIIAAIDRGGAGVDEDLDSKDSIEALVRRWSLPSWLARRWVRELGDERARARARALSEPPYIDLRLDLSSGEADSLRQRLAEEHPRAHIEAPLPGQPQCLRTRRAGDIFYGPMHEEGLLSVQSFGSQQAVISMAPTPGERVLDACAGMGTKTLQIAELMGRRGDIVALDLDAKKLESFTEMIERGRLETEALQLRFFEADLVQRLAPHLGTSEQSGDRSLVSFGDDDPCSLALAAPFDAILLDAPCTGLGDLGRHPELRQRVRPEQLRASTALQSKMLRACASRLAPGGRLLYAVCSLEPEEGRDLVAAVAPECGLDIVESHTWTPEEHACDGFFHSLLRRPAS